MRFASFSIIATSLLAIVTASPITLSGNAGVPNTNYDAAVTSKHRDLDPARLPQHYSPILGRARTVAQKQATAGAKQAKQAATKAAKAEQGKKNAAAEKAKAKVTFGKSAKEGLDNLGLHGKDRKDAKNYHKQTVKAEMKTNGATTAKVVHLDHKGGSVAEEKNHITTHFYDKNKATIPSTWTDKKTGQVNNGELHHVYPDQHGVKPPTSFTNAVANSPGNPKQAAKKAAADAEKEKKEKEKADRAAANRAAGLAKQAALKAGKGS